MAVALMMYKTATQQIKAMQRRRAGFSHTVTATSVVWHGSVRPNEIAYLIQIEAVIDHNDAEVQFLKAPLVRVIRPRLQLRWDVEEAPLPHAYLDSQAPELSPLCLFDPANHEWTPDDLIADTIVPWACEWLACYEMWLATGRWFGGGRHDYPTFEESSA